MSVGIKLLQTAANAAITEAKNSPPGQLEAAANRCEMLMKTFCDRNPDPTVHVNASTQSESGPGKPRFR